MNKWMDRCSIYLWAWLLVSLSVACTDDREVFGEYRPSDVIAFKASLHNDVQAVVGRGVSSFLSIEEEEWPLETVEHKDSRGTVVSALNDVNVGVFGYIASDNTEVFHNASFTFKDNENLLPDAGSSKAWNDDGVKDKGLKFYTYAPRMENITVSGAAAEAGPGFTYTVSSVVAEQKDIIASDMKEVEANYNQYIPLIFSHVLTGVRFKLGNFESPVKVTSLKVEGVYGTGTYTLGDAWNIAEDATTVSFELIKNGTNTYNEGDVLTDGENTLMMIPQLLPGGSKVVLTYEMGGQTGTREASLAGLKWEPGKLITYTINHAPPTQDYIYFDLHAGDVDITPTSYSGKVYVNGVATDVSAASVDISALKFYVYQSTEANKATTGWETAIGTGTCRIPQYAPVKVGDKFWSEFITNNQSVEDVIEAWDNKGGTAGAVIDAKRTHTLNKISVTCPEETSITCDLTIDNLYSRYQEASVSRTTGGITFYPLRDNSTLTINLVGDNRFGAVHYCSKLSNNQLILQGTGSLTVADVDFNVSFSTQSQNNGEGVEGYFSNYWCSAIGGNDSSQGNAIGIVIKGGTIFAGTTLAENCTAIGGGGNDKGVVTIEGGTVTAVAATTGVAIGGGIGFNSQGGIGIVNISGGNVYAYNLGNEWEIPSAAIGSAGSSAKYGGEGTVNISGNAYVYAQTALGTAIGGGSSKTQHGGNATVNISGNCYVIAKSIEAIDKKTGTKYPAGNGIGGGTGGTGKASDKEDAPPAYGGSATVTISGNPTIRTGSIGGGKTNNPNGKIGSANINVSGGNILGQFVLAGGAGEGQTSSFTMSGKNTVISNSDVYDKEYYHVQTNGGAVYMEDGTFTMSEGTIRNCTANTGGAVYIKKSANALLNPKFIMTGGTIEDCMSETHGGAVYLEVGSVELSGNAKIQKNLAQCGNGGAVYITAGDFSMNGTSSVEYNSALTKNADQTIGHGGGIYVTSSELEVNVNVLSGTIRNNTSDGNGGGVCVDMAETTAIANIKIGEVGSQNLDNPDITKNESVMYGGGLYAKGQNAKVDINGGIIMDNTVSNYVPNENVYNDKGTVTLIGGKVTHVIVTFDANAYNDEDRKERDETALLDGNATATQKIVTDTNSLLVQPKEIKRSYYNFVEWNTMPDGSGKSYKDGETVNIKENLTLYAQWEFQKGQ